ncbi:NHL repeat-containing protein [Sphingosinicella sp. YJ22]|uniref:NHL repeat-containing protein n=1 Tax=Sphingosinicella sp. YJ22 TaxID=1104780 RepID=UPI0014096741|nr:NHL repeat-containing protein [Sphingosinicella sp. YJ22]
MRRLIAIAAALLIAGCGDEEGRVVMLDPGYRLELAADQSVGIVAVDGLLWHDGTLFMADEAGVAVRRWAPGQHAETLADARDGLSSPEDIVRDAAGNLYVTDDNIGGVRRISPDGRVAVVAGPQRRLPSTEGLAITPAGVLLVGDGEAHRIAAIAPDGRMAELVGPEAGIAKPESLALDGQGNLYIADNEAATLYLRTSDGRITAPISGREGFSPESIAWIDGALFITDSDHGLVYRYTPEAGLAPIAAFVGALANVQGITSDGAGGLYVSVRAGEDERRGYILRLARTR